MGAQALVGPYRALRLSCKLDVWWDSSGVVSSKVRRATAPTWRGACAPAELCAGGRGAASAGRPKASGGACVALRPSPLARQEFVRYLPLPGGPQPGDADPSANVTTINLALAGVVEAIHGSVGPSSAALLDLIVSILAG